MLQIPQMTSVRQFSPGNIVRVQAHSNYCKIYFTNQEAALVVSKVLRWVEERLPADMFIRVHRSHLVNKGYVHTVKGTQAKTVVMTNGEWIAVSRRRHGIVQQICQPKSQHG